ncbi:HpcH/HpaI aldolase/citrate lyase family protein [Microbacterium sp. P06]|uniref:HpcH/HpaI aldolase/citrate lyase family protein n=1 Tax=unclassified Microbacterium TaxID=2609290 RepID=UPI0037462714
MTARTTMTALYVPGDRPDRVAKALRIGADGVIVDLEDAVAPGSKEAAREALATLTDELAAATRDGAHVVVQVRINARGSLWHDADVAALAELPRGIGVRLPKTQSVDDVAALRTALPGRDVHALLETALAVERAFDIASSGVASISTGEADLRAALAVPAGEEGEEGLRWSRSRIVNAAAAAGLPAPLLSVYADVNDLEGLERSSREGLRLGFAGRTAIHPRQLEVIRRVFTPTAAQVERAEQIVRRVSSAAADGSGTVVLDDGTFLDIAMVRAAERVIAAAGS